MKTRFQAKASAPAGVRADRWIVWDAFYRVVISRHMTRAKARMVAHALQATYIEQLIAAKGRTI